MSYSSKLLESGLLAMTVIHRSVPIIGSCCRFLAGSSGTVVGLSEKLDGSSLKQLFRVSELSVVSMSVNSSPLLGRLSCS